MEDHERYSRQVKLPQVGASGQKRIFETALVLPPHVDAATALIAQLYARAAGHGVAGGAGSSSPPPPSTSTEPVQQSFASSFRHAEARAVGLGAALALATTLSALDIDINSPPRST